VRKVIVIVGCFVMLVSAQAASAASGTSQDAYSSPSKQLQVAVAATPKAPQAGGELPLTGMDLSVIGVAGLGLAGMGFALRRLADRREKE